MIFDKSGNLYGTTDIGGPPCTLFRAIGCGTVFELSPNPDGTWTESVLHNFGNGADGVEPEGGLIFDAAGNLYGTTLYGGVDGQGVVLKLKPNSNGTWTESVLHTFTGGADGAGPFAALIFDAAGILYGTTLFGGAEGYGVVFKVTPTSSGWKETVLHTFIGCGRSPKAPVTFDSAGKLYGTTSDGNQPSDYGLVFRITP